MTKTRRGPDPEIEDPKMLSAKVPGALVVELDAYARIAGVSRSEAVRRLLSVALDERPSGADR